MRKQDLDFNFNTISNLNLKILYGKRIVPKLAYVVKNYFVLHVKIKKKKLFR